ncbi:T9SS type A sorting domain-containing protein [Cytophagaceae bacterium DM2B3-1]|uniref:T9SS type A sorting domain-containing protein n=1 Tax=Xanthocytophaga flava TaxID=3048013 RepID=A0ABT7CSF6_9BACT|nr:T9SS type A sorting domain-containing protein [Xanthocytophaga flavus]MDJ1496669.1 T9SS type A sorting domain-containing protein [Xanthocytophaga flavus]
MVKNYFLSGIFLLFSYCSLTAQTGPGGVGQTGASGNIGLWLRADNITNTPTGTTISSWADASGRGSNATQATTVNRPTYISNSGISSKPAVRFDGSNDLMTITSSNILNGNTGSNYDALTYYAVVRMYNLNNNTTRGIISKRASNTVNSNYAYDLYLEPNDLFYDVVNGNNRDVENNFNLDYGNNESYIIGFRFDGNQGNNIVNNRGALYDPYDNPQYFNHSFTTLNNSTSPVTIGALTGDNNSYSNMDVAEIIQFGRSLNEAERNILDNYLSSKYNIPIDNDYFSYDNTGNNGNNYYGNDVAGIGRSGNATQTDALGTGMLRVTLNNTNNLDNGDYLFWGHNGTPLNILSSNVPASFFGNGQRLSRLWRFDATNNVGTITVTFDVSSIPTITATNYGSLRLLIDSDGNFGSPTNNTTIVASPSPNFSGNNRLVSFTVNNVGNYDGAFFTLATNDVSTTPLPVTFISFDATNQAGKVALKWYTASEENNSHFTVERSHNGQDWETVTTVNGAGNSDQALGYTAYDNNPYQGTSYYRIKQTDYNGEFSYSRIATVTVLGANSEVTLSPNPVKDDILRLTFAEGLQISQVVITNTLGQEVYRKNISQVQELEINTQGYPTGAYFVIISGNNYHKTSKILVER